jgi:hypothetical protein
MKAKFEIVKKEVVTVVEEKIVNANFTQAEWNLLTLFVRSVAPVEVNGMFKTMKSLGISNISQEGLKNSMDVARIMNTLANEMIRFTS